MKVEQEISARCLWFHIVLTEVPVKESCISFAMADFFFFFMVEKNKSKPQGCCYTVMSDVCETDKTIATTPWFSSSTSTHRRNDVAEE